MGGNDNYSTSVFLEKILRYYYMPTIGVADLQAPLNNIVIANFIRAFNKTFSTVYTYI